MFEPCRGCTERHVGCHGGCDKYKAFVEENERIKQRRAEYLKEESIFYDLRARGINRRR